MKKHIIKEYLKTGKRITHYKTKCGLIRHTTASSFATEEINKVTCKNCKNEQKQRTPRTANDPHA